MSYLTPRDYKKTIQADNLQQVIGGDDTILTDAMETAVEEAQSHLVQKYVVDREFQDVVEWDKTDSYLAFDRVYLDAPLFNAANTYALGAYVTYAQSPTAKYLNVYRANVAIIVAAPFNAAQWDLVGIQYDIYTPKLPAPEFNYLAHYKVGDLVIWRDKKYTCAIATGTITQDLALQFGTYQNIPKGNVFPDDLVNGLQYWGAGVAFNVPANTQIDNTTYWEKNDPRSKQVVKCVVDITLYYVHDRIAPRNIPDLRVKNYDDSIRKLKGFAEGDTTNVKMALIQPKQGQRVRFGGNVKNNNTY
jgi:hypothetical protein